MSIDITSLSSLVSIALAFHGFALALLILISKKWNRLIFTYVALLVVLSLILVEYFFAYSGLETVAPHIIAIKIPLLILIGPLYFLWSTYKSGREAKLSDLIHAIPFVIICLFLGPFYVLPASEKLQVASSDGGSVIRSVYLIVTFLHLLFYVMLTRRRMKGQDAKVREKALHKQLHIGFSLLLLAFGLTIIYFILGKVGLGHNRFFFVIGMGLMIHVLTYVLLKRPQSFVIKANLIDQELSSLAARVQQYLQEDRPYLHKGFNKADLAVALSSNQNYISRAFNDVLNTSFTTYVNQLRIEEAKKLLINSDQKVYAIALNAGFTSSNSFTRVFKQYTNQTPAEFRNSNRDI